MTQIAINHDGHRWRSCSMLWHSHLAIMFHGRAKWRGLGGSWSGSSMPLALCLSPLPGGIPYDRSITFNGNAETRWDGVSNQIQVCAQIIDQKLILDGVHIQIMAKHSPQWRWLKVSHRRRRLTSKHITSYQLKVNVKLINQKPWNRI